LGETVVSSVSPEARVEPGVSQRVLVELSVEVARDPPEEGPAASERAEGVEGPPTAGRF